MIFMQKRKPKSYKSRRHLITTYMNLKLKTLKFLLALCVATASMHGQIVNGDFGTGSFSGWSTSGGCAGGSVGIMTGGPQIYTGMGGGINWADLTGCGWGNGRWIEQAVPTVAGQTYFLDFDIGCWNGLCFTDGGANLYIDGILINRYAHTDFSGNWMVWKHFQYCFTAAGSSTKINFTGNGWGTSLTPSWANTGGSTTGLGYEFSGVIGLDNIALSTNPVFDITVTDTCAPAWLYTSPRLYGASIDWYLNGGLISSGTADSLLGSLPGIYKYEYNSGCGVFSVEKELKYCDTCHIEMTSQYYCVDKPTIFTFNPSPGCIDPECIGEITIEYGDGTVADYSPGGPATFPHQYTSPGIYSVKYCWINKCTREYICKELMVTIEKCSPCINMTADYFCVDDSTIFNFSAGPRCIDPKCIGEVNVDYGDGTAGGFASGTPVRFAHKYTNPGIYTVTWCWQNMCTGEIFCDKFEVTIVQCEECRINPDFKFTGCIPVDFTNTSTSNYHVTNISWDFGDGGTSNAANPTHNYSGPGSYYVCLTIETAGRDGRLCKETICREIEVRHCEGTPGGGANPVAQNKQLNAANGSNFEFEKEGMPAMTVFPNPANGDASVASLVLTSPGITVYLYDITGRLLYQHQTEGGKKELTLPTGNLDPGIYLIKVKGPGYNKEQKLIRK